MVLCVPPRSLTDRSARKTNEMSALVVAEDRLLISRRKFCVESNGGVFFTVSSIDLLSPESQGGREVD